MDDKSTPISSLNNNMTPDTNSNSNVVNQILNKYNNLQETNENTLPPPNPNIAVMENNFENRNLNQELYNLKSNNIQFKEHHDKEMQRLSVQQPTHQQQKNIEFEEEDEYVEYEVEELPLWKRIINEIRIPFFIFIFILCIFNTSFDKLLITKIPFFGNQFNESNIMGFLLKAFIVSLLSYILIRFVRV